MANIQLSAYRTGVVVLAGASEMNSLAAANVGAITATGSGVILDNTGNKDILCDFELFTSTLSGAPVSGAVFELHAYFSFDGTNYGTSLAAGATLPLDPPIGLFVMNGVGTSQRAWIRGFSLSPGKYKFALANRTAVALPSTLAVVTAYAYAFTSI
jgi:hypothetical protein